MCKRGVKNMQKKKKKKSVDITLFDENVVWQSKGDVCLRKRVKSKGMKEDRWIKGYQGGLNRIVWCMWIPNEIVSAGRKCVGYWRSRKRW